MSSPESYYQYFEGDSVVTVPFIMDGMNAGIAHNSRRHSFIPVAQQKTRRPAVENPGLPVEKVFQACREDPVP